jgi:ATP-binding protein involved in chromosome partitioning
MNQTIQSQAEACLLAYLDPYLQKTWGEAKVVKAVSVVDQQVMAQIQLGYPIARVRQELDQAIREQLLAIPGVTGVTVELTSRIEARVAQPGVQAIPQVKNVIAIASGKGGVGKSTTAVNIALALSQHGAAVGILDADIYGPNQPQMLGSSGRIAVENGQRLPPRLAHGIQSMSMGYLIDPHTPMVWRGPMVSSALQQLAQETAWENLDYLVIDLPPGTGDIQLTLSQKIPVNGAVIVTTPQDVALLDARKGLEMFRKVNVKVLGVVENMSMHVCSACGHHEAIFGEGGAESLAQACGAELLGRLPLVKTIREQADKGEPIVVAYPEGDITKLYREIALKIAAKLSLEAKNYAAKFPKIVIQG